MNKTTKKICFSLVVLTILASSIAEARIGGGRSFGSRGSRGFGGSSSFSRSNSYSRPSTPSQPSSPSQPYNPAPAYRSSGPSFMKSLGAGIAGGFLGSLLFRSIGGGGSSFASMGGAGSGGGIGFLEILLIAGAAFLLIRYLMNRKPATQQGPDWRSQNSGGSDDGSRMSYSNNNYNEPAATGADALMRQAKPYGWNDSAQQSAPSSQLDPETASDLFFRIQASWGNRDLSPVAPLLDDDARQYLDQQIALLKNNRQFNRLENIAIRNVDVVEAWREDQKDYSTIRFLANVLDYTVSEDSQQVVDGSKTTPVKFEEYWTFSKTSGSPSWKLSAIQQS